MGYEIETSVHPRYPQIIYQRGSFFASGDSFVAASRR